MKVFVVFIFTLCTLHLVLANVQHEHEQDLQDNEFAEFEDFDEETDSQKETKSAEVNKGGKTADKTPQDDDDEAVVETEEDEFDVLDPEEFEGLPGDDTIWENGKTKKKKSEPKLKFAKVPIHKRSWDKYYLEFLMSAGLAIYLMNFFIGKSKNSSIASAWMNENLEFLQSQFELVGDDPLQKATESTHQLLKQSEYNYTLWCSGRQCCEGMLVDIKLLKRQDLISVISNRLKPSAADQLSITVTLTDMDPYVMCVGTRKAVSNLHKNMQDLSTFCTEKSKSGDKFGLSPNLHVLSEIYGDLVTSILNDKVIKVFNECGSVFESMHISDQYSGVIPSEQDEQTPKQPDTEKVLILTMNIPKKGQSDVKGQQHLSSLLKLSMYLVDRVRKFRLSKESKAKAEKHRQVASTKYLKLTHAQRQEAAQLKREEKERALKERMMSEEDPDKQRRMDEMIHKKELSKKNKKMMKNRSYKVKAM